MEIYIFKDVEYNNCINCTFLIKACWSCLTVLVSSQDYFKESAGVFYPFIVHSFYFQMAIKKSKKWQVIYLFIFDLTQKNGKRVCFLYFNFRLRSKIQIGKRATGLNLIFILVGVTWPGNGSARARSGTGKAVMAALKLRYYYFD